MRSFRRLGQAPAASPTSTSSSGQRHAQPDRVTSTPWLCERCGDLDVDVQVG
jgi:hypothetical protein